MEVFFTYHTYSYIMIGGTKGRNKINIALRRFCKHSANLCSYYSNVPSCNKNQFNKFKQGTLERHIQAYQNSPQSYVDNYLSNVGNTTQYVILSSLKQLSGVFYSCYIFRQGKMLLGFLLI